MNFEEKWNRDNNAENVYASGYSVINDTIGSTYYKTDLFKLIGGEYSYDSKDNSKYKVVSYFRNDIIGYNKEKDRYFPIFIESCTMGCNKDIEVDDSNNLIISYEQLSDSEYRIPLDRIIFDNNQGD